MRFVADEGVDKVIVDRLRKDGHEILYVMESEPSISDDEVILRSNDNQAVLITTDKDFGELVFRQGRIAYGVILVRLAGLSPGRKSDMVANAIRDHTGELVHSFIVITPAAVRIRKRG